MENKSGLEKQTKIYNSIEEYQSDHVVPKTGSQKFCYEKGLTVDDSEELDLIVAQAVQEAQSSSYAQGVSDTVSKIREQLLGDVDYWSNVSDIDGGQNISHLKLIPKELVKRNIEQILDHLEVSDKEGDRK